MQHRPKGREEESTPKEEEKHSTTKEPRGKATSPRKIITIPFVKDSDIAKAERPVVLLPPSWVVLFSLLPSLAVLIWVVLHSHPPLVWCSFPLVGGAALLLLLWWWWCSPFFLRCPCGWCCLTDPPLGDAFSLLPSLVVGPAGRCFFADPSFLVMLGGAVSLTGFWVVLGTNQFGRSKNSGSPNPEPLESLVLGLFLLFCVLLLGSLGLGVTRCCFRPCSFVWCCFSLLFLWGGAAFLALTRGWWCCLLLCPSGRCCSLHSLVCGAVVPFSFSWVVD